MMTAKFACVLPKGLMHEEVFCCVPDEIKETEKEEDTLHTLIMVKLAPMSTMNVVPHTSINVKTFLMHKG